MLGHRYCLVLRMQTVSLLPAASNFAFDFQQFTCGVVGESSRKFAKHTFNCVRKGLEILRKIAEILQNFSAMPLF